MPGRHLPLRRVLALVLLCLAMVLSALAGHPAAASPPDGGLSPHPAMQSGTTMWPPMIFAITCSVYADNFFSMEGIGLDLPEGCAFDAGASFTISDASGNFYGSCVAGDDGYCRGDVSVPVDVEVLVTQDEASIPAGYVVVGGNPQALTYPASGMRGEGVPWLFVTMPAEIAGGQAGAPTGATEVATEAAPATETATAAAPATGGVASARIEPRQDWIAYVGEDGNIWLMQPDGSQQVQVTTDAAMESAASSYTMPVWSPDGTILVFHKTDEGIMVYRNGKLSLVPNTARCGPAAITRDNSRLLYSCASGEAPYESDPTTDQLATDPNLAAIASSNLDGTDARVLVPYALSITGPSEIPWVSSGAVGFNTLAGLAINSSTGEILATFGFLHSRTAWIVAPDGTSPIISIPYSDANLDRLGPFAAAFLPGSEQIVALVCEQGCYPGQQEQVRAILILNRDGSIVQRLVGSDTVPGLADFTVSPDAATVVFSTYSSTDGGASSMLWSMPIGGGVTPLRAGSSPAWQPNPGVKAQRPASPEAAPTAESPAAPEVPVATSTNPITGVWSGTGYQSPQAIEWPIVIQVNDGAVGEVVGRVEYPSYGCVGELTLTSVNEDGSITLRERIVEGVGTCVDGGQFTLRRGGEGSVTFHWVAPDGSSSAEGTLAPVSGGAAPPAADAPGGDAMTGPPLLYDDAEAEPVPIEAEGG